MMKKRLRLRAGDWIEVRSKEEVLATLDKQGRLEGLPFMPEMFAYCGRRMQVLKRAHKTCDTVFPIRGRRMLDGVHLEARCSGEAHGGCQASCQIFWKEAWLKRVSNDASGSLQTSVGEDTHSRSSGEGNPCTEQDVLRGTIDAGWEAANGPKYVCQNTQVPYFTSELPWWRLSQYIEDWTSGNVTLWQVIKGMTYSAYYHLSQSGMGLGKMLRWLYNVLHPLRRGTLWPRTRGMIPVGHPTPTTVLNLQPGELVRVKSHREILATLNTDSKNRGMYWDAEMVPYCGGTYRVLKRVSKIIDEKTGRMIEMKNPCIILDSVVCQSRYSHCRMFCPRAFYSYWREVWLERVEDQGTSLDFHGPELA